MKKPLWSLNRTEASELAQKIARDIFSAGDMENDKVQRIQFRGGKYGLGGKETDLGGFCEEALAQRIDASLRDVRYEITPVLQRQNPPETT